MLTVVDMENLIGMRIPHMVTAFIGGSRAMVDPPPTDTDLDVCVHVEDLLHTLNTLTNKGWSRCGDYVGIGSTFAAVRHGEVNLMLFEDAYEFGAVWGATCVGKQQNLQSKADRYKLFETAREPWRREQCT
jgi:hypothetical protein